MKGKGWNSSQWESQSSKSNRGGKVPRWESNKQQQKKVVLVKEEGGAKITFLSAKSGTAQYVGLSKAAES